jgi:uncharacterized membrane protein
MVEALTIVLAVGVTTGWKSAWAGALSAAIVLILIVLIGGSALLHIDLRPFQVIIGTLLILFGMRWLRKAVLRYAGYIPMHDEDAIFKKEVEVLGSRKKDLRFGVDAAGTATAFQGVLIEGLEVVFIVLAVGKDAQRLEYASIGAGIALVTVLLLGVILHTPLSKIPENMLKFVVGVMLMSLGTVWTGEGIGLTWPYNDWMLIIMAIIYLTIASCMAVIMRKPMIMS